MANPVVDVIKQVPKSERLSVATEIMACKTSKEAVEVAKTHGITITVEQFEDIKAFLKSKPSDAELREIVEAVVPKIMAGPALAALKSKLKL